MRSAFLRMLSWSAAGKERRMKLAHELTRDQLVTIVRFVQDVLWLDAEDDGKGDLYDPNKEWDCDALDYIGTVMAEHGLRPARRRRVRRQTEDLVACQGITE